MMPQMRPLTSNDSLSTSSSSSDDIARRFGRGDSDRLEERARFLVIEVEGREVDEEALGLANFEEEYFSDFSE